MYANVFKFSKQKKRFAGESKLNSKCFPLPSGRHVDPQHGVSTLIGSLWYFD